MIDRPIPVVIPTPRWRQVLLEVAKRHKVRVSDLTGRSRIYKHAFARQEAYWALRQLHDGRAQGSPYSYLSIARIMGRDHQSIIHGVRRHLQRMALESSDT